MEEALRNADSANNLRLTITLSEKEGAKPTAPSPATKPASEVRSEIPRAPSGKNDLRRLPEEAKQSIKPIKDKPKVQPVDNAGFTLAPLDDNEEPESY